MSEHEHKYKLNVKGGYYYCYCGESDLTIKDLMKEYIENHARIKALEGVVSEKWISVDEKLPERGQRVLILWGGDVDIGWISTYFKAKKWYTAFDKHYSISGVTHWMPLPNPPKEEEV